jgi:hypothetical protein
MRLTQSSSLHVDPGAEAHRPRVSVMLTTGAAPNDPVPSAGAKKREPDQRLHALLAVDGAERPLRRTVEWSGGSPPRAVPLSASKKRSGLGDRS